MMKIHEGHTRASASPPLCLALVSDQKRLEPVTDPSLSIIRERDVNTSLCLSLVHAAAEAGIVGSHELLDLEAHDVFRSPVGHQDRKSVV